MILNNRQTAIIYELLESKDYLTYEYLCAHFHSSEKTIRTDIKKLNDFFKKDDIKINLKHGKGFMIECNEDRRNALMSNFNYRYKDYSEIKNIHNKKDLSILYYLSKGPITEEELSNKLYTSKKNISNIIAYIRERMSGYNLEIKHKPYYGLCLTGDEVNIRNFFIDSASFMATSDINEIFYDNASMFNIDNKEIKDVLNILIKGISDFKIRISQHSLIVMVVSITISRQRIQNGFYVNFTSKQHNLISNYIYYKSFNKILDEIEKYYDLKFDIYERDFIIAYGLISNTESKEIFVEQLSKNKIKEIERSCKKLQNVFIKYNLCEASQLSLFDKESYKLMRSAYIRKELSYIENDFNNAFRVAMIETPIAMMVGYLLYSELKKTLNYNYGRYLLMSYSIAAYDQIRYIDRTYRMAKVAIFTPLNKESCRSLVDRINYQYDNVISKIDILTTSDIIAKDLDEYDLLLHFDDYEQLGIHSDVDKLKISFFFDENDKINLYSKLSVMTRSYKRAFARISEKDIFYDDSKIKGLYDVVQYVRSLCKNDELLLEQLESIPLSDILVHNEIFNIVLFASKEEYRNTKIIKLNKPIKYNDQDIYTVVVNIIWCNGDLRQLKTIESIVRKISSKDYTELTNKDYQDLIR